MLPPRLRPAGWLIAVTVLALGSLAPAGEKVQENPKPCPAAKGAKPDRSKERAKSLADICSRFGVGKGSAIADVGAGGGQDTWAFANIVGETGTVFSQELGEGKVKALKKEAENRKLSQIRTVVGRTDDPALPAASADLVFLHYVYHHFAKPREMLRGIWRSLKPGGHLVVIDKQPGTLQDWVAEKIREGEHHWTAETTVVRQAREEGFAFAGLAEDCWYQKGEFVLVFQRPQGLRDPGSDPDTFLSLPVEETARLLLPLGRPYQRPVFVALGQSRELLAPLMKASAGPGLDVVLEEWATQKDEKPPLSAQVALPSVLTQKGDPRLGPEPIDAVFFLDSYHLLFHGPTLLSKLRERLSPTGCIYVFDREAKEPVSRRETSHSRRIARETVIQEMSKAGFSLWFCGPQPAPDRFLLVFGKTPPADVSPADDPFIGGPEISGPPENWLKQNLWRLRGMKAVEGKVVPIAADDRGSGVEAVAAAIAGKQAWRLPRSKIVLSFEEKGADYLLTKFSATGQ
jgi:predicted methyltransferase